MKILLVDDSEIFRNELLKVLHRLNQNINVVEASSVKEALTLIESEQFNLLILDFQLSDSTSVDILKEIKNKNITSKKIVLTNHFNPTIKDICYKNGTDHFVDKSGSFIDLIDVLKVYLSA